MNFEELRNKVIQEKRNKNLDKFYQNLCSDSLSKEDKVRVKNKYERYSQLFKSYEDFISHCKLLKINCIGLEKEPTKQRIDEILEIETFNQIYKRKIQKLPDRGLKSICINKNTHELSSAFGLNSINQRTKTFDAIEDFEGKKIYYCIKYTKENGGAQDNQVQDVNIFYQEILKYVEHHPNDNTNFGFILAGQKLKSFYLEYPSTDRIKIYYLE